LCVAELNISLFYPLLSVSCGRLTNVPAALQVACAFELLPVLFPAKQRVVAWAHRHKWTIAIVALFGLSVVVAARIGHAERMMVDMQGQNCFQVCHHLKCSPEQATRSEALLAELAHAKHDVGACASELHSTNHKLAVAQQHLHSVQARAAQLEAQLAARQQEVGYMLQKCGSPAGDLLDMQAQRDAHAATAQHWHQQAQEAAHQVKRMEMAMDAQRRADGEATAQWQQRARDAEQKVKRLTSNGDLAAAAQQWQQRAQLAEQHFKQLELQNKDALKRCVLQSEHQIKVGALLSVIDSPHLNRLVRQELSAQLAEAKEHAERLRLNLQVRQVCLFGPCCLCSHSLRPSRAIIRPVPTSCTAPIRSGLGWLRNSLVCPFVILLCCLCLPEL
jgi:hypothetical protein